MANVILVIHLFLALAIILLVLLQRSEGGGLGIGGGGGLGGLSTAKGAANALTKATAICAGLFFCTSLVLGILAGQTSSARKGILEGLESAPAAVEAAAEVDELEAPVSESVPAEPAVPIAE